MSEQSQAQRSARLMELVDVASSLRVSIYTLRRWAAAGRLPHVRLGRKIQVDPADLENFIKSRKRGGRTTPGDVA